jgi:hypothetical protein
MFDITSNGKAVEYRSSAKQVHPDIILIRDFLDESRCAELVKFIDTNGLIKQLGTFSDGHTIQLVCSEEVRAPNWLYQQVENGLLPLMGPALKKPVVGRRVTTSRAAPGAHVKWHTDRDISGQDRYKVCVYLNCNVGTSFQHPTMPDCTCTVGGVRGSVVIFDMKLRHCSAPIVEGIKYVIGLRLLDKSCKPQQQRVRRTELCSTLEKLLAKSIHHRTTKV